MKQLAEYIFSSVVRSLQNNNEKQVIRIDGFEDLRLYHHICSKVNQICVDQGWTLLAKLSLKKYLQFKELGKWPAELAIMETNSWIDKDDHMTSYRNQLPEDGKKLVVLLLGTEMVDDKGGLNDFYAITPNRIDLEIGNKYSKLISKELQEVFSDTQIGDIIDRFFGDLFSCVPKNLSQVSDVLDYWLIETPTVKEAMADLFASLPRWGIPKVVDEIENMSPAKYLSQKKKDSLVINAYNFIKGKTYARVTKTTIAKIQKQFDAYKGTEDKAPGKYYDAYPEGQALETYDSLEKAVLLFVMGDRSEELCDKLIYTDFSILEDVLSLRLPGRVGPKPDPSAKRIAGMPLSVVLRVMLSALKNNQQRVDGVRITWKQAKISGVPSGIGSDQTERDALLLEAWNAITRFAGGVDAFISKENWQGGDHEQVNLSMIPVDFLLPISGSKMVESGMVSAGPGSVHKINFIVEAMCGDEVVGNEEYYWAIDPNEDWILAFRDFVDMPDEDTSYIPFGVLPEINSAFTLKDEDGFAYWITHARLEFLKGNDSLWYMLDRDFRQMDAEAELSRFNSLGKRFQEFRKQVLEKGFYNSINEKASIFLEEYISLVDHIKTDPVYVGKLYPIVGKLGFFFTICADSKPVMGNASSRQIIVPPWHPASLEKISDQMAFIRTGMYEWNINNSDQRKSLEKRLDELISLSTIRNATDGFFCIGGKLMIHGASYGYYSLYGDPQSDVSYTSAQLLEFKEVVFSDDFDDADMKRMSREAQMLLSTINKYVSTYPQAKRNLSVCFINPEDLQIIVSALYKYVSDLRKDEPSITASIQMSVITRNNTAGARTYLAYWINNVFSQDDNLDIKAYLQIYEHESDIPKLVSATTDLTFFFDAMNTDHNADYKFQNLITAEKMSDCRFPMIFKPALKAKYGLHHTIDITQPQFRAATAHTQLLRVYNDKYQYDFNSAVIQTSEGDIDRGKIISDIQRQTVWLCCIDSAMDKYTVRELYAKETGIIGFTTGEGSYGQLNLAITCKNDVKLDMLQRCSRRLKKMFPSWTQQQLDDAAACCLKKAGELDGVSILRAMNPNDYDMNNFLAYLIGNELIERHENRLEVLIRLDSYQHWLDDQIPDEKGRKKYPDFLLIEADIKSDQPLHIDATIVEAKIAKATNMLVEHLPKAQKQIKQGLEVLGRHFDPDSKSIERRYWLAQLYRALAFLQAEIHFSDSAFPLLQAKMNELIEGQFTIDWHGRILACEIDKVGLIDHLPLNDEGVEVDCWLVGQNAIQNILLGQAIDTAVPFDSNAQAEDEETEPAADDFYDDIPDEPSDSFVPIEDKRVDDDMLTDNIPDTPVSEETNSSSDNEDEKKKSDDEKIVPQTIESDVSEGQDNTVEHTESTMAIEDIRLLIGQDRSKRPVFWEFGHKQLANRHLLITGGSGQGKTYAIQTLLFELARQNISSVVFDYTDGFLPGKLEPPFESTLGDKIQQHYAIAGQLPINPFKRQPLMIPGLPEGILEQSTNVASRFAAIMKHVYSFGEQQTSALYDACKKGIDHFGDQMDFKKLRELLDADPSSYAKTASSKMRQLFDLDLFDTQSAFDWSSITDRVGKVTVIQLTNLDREIQTAITEMLMWDAWYSLVKFGDKSRPFVVVLDEAQNLSFEDGSPAQKILQEGRKYGWSAWFATQFMKGALSSDEISRLQQAAETLYFKPSAEETSSIASKLADSNMTAAEWTDVLKQMQKGYCIVKGDRILVNGRFGAAPGTIVKVSSFEERT